MAPTEARASSQALLQSPFSPLFEFELDIKRQSSARLDRCFSEQALALQELDAGAPQTLLQQILSRCRCTSPAAAQVRPVGLQCLLCCSSGHRGGTGVGFL